MDVLQQRLRRLFAFRRGVLALDTEPAELAARLRAASVVPSPRMVEDYIAMLLYAPGLPAAVSGVVLRADRFDSSLPEVLGASGILAGVRADTGHETLTGDARHRVTSGLDGLAARLIRLRELGATFAVWSAVAGAEADDRAMQILTANGHAAARFAHLCHDLGLVAVIRIGTRVGGVTGPRRDATMAAALLSVGGYFYDHGVDASTVVVCAELGDDSALPLTVLPDELGGVLLGGHGDTSTAAAVAAGLGLAPPWPVGFYAGHQITTAALRAWRGHAVDDGRRALLAGLDAVSAPTARVG